MSSTISGSCLCGSVKYEIVGQTRSFFHCHCKRCRKASGTGHASNLIVKPVSADWMQGKDLISEFPVPGAKRFKTVFCNRCGSPLPRIAPDLSIAVVPAGSLDSKAEVGPTDRIFWESRSDWSCESGDLPTWAEYPERQ